MRKFLALFTLCLGAFAQSTTVSSNTSGAQAVTASVQAITCSSMFPQATLTDAIYWAHQPPAVQSLQTYSGNDIVAKAMGLATQGFTIDVPVMVWHWDPVCTMGYRQEYGYTWVPSALQAAPVIAPGISQPGTPSYNPSQPPAGSILVSLNAADYPPFNPPLPVPPPATNVVGVCYPGTGICNVGPGLPAGIVDGATVSQNGASYLFHAVATPFGTSKWFSPVGQ
jgi:hypothetical protein